MAFEIGDKVTTYTGLYMSGGWREIGTKGKVVKGANGFGLLTVKFKGVEELRFIRPEYLVLRKAAKVKRPFKVGDTVALKEDVYSTEGAASAGADAEVVEAIPDSNLVVIEFLNGGKLTVAEDVLTKTEVVEDKPRPFEEGDSVVFKKDVVHGLTVEVVKGVWAEVVTVIPDSDEVVVGFDDFTTLTVSEEVLASEAETFGEVEADEPANPFEVGDTVYVKHDASVIGMSFINGGSEGFVIGTLDDDGVIVNFGQGLVYSVRVSDLSKEPQKYEGRVVGDASPEVQEALALVLERIEEIKELLTSKPQNVVNVYSSEASFVTEPEEEEPAPEPVFKKAKEVKAGDLLYTEAGVWDKVNRIETKDSGYTSLYGTFGNKITQVPSGRVVQVLEEVS